MVKIEVNDNSLLVENYQNILNNLSWLDVADKLEDHGVFIRIDNSINVPIATYKQHKYIVKDSHINQLENENQVVFQKYNGG